MIAGTAVLVAPRLGGTSSGGGSDSTGWSAQWIVHSFAPNTRDVVVSVALLWCGAAGLWLARERRAVLLAVAVAILGAAASAWTIAVTGGHRRLSSAAYAAVSLGTSQSRLLARFGAPVSTDASATSPRERTLRCVVYLPRQQVSDDVYLFCFDAGRLRRKEAW